jgi:phosphoribosylaminoimidazole-succinocarboxamide synthase
MERGFSGQPGESLPEMTEEFIKEISDRYIELYEKTTGKKFIKPSAKEDPYRRIENNILSALKKLK